MSAFLDRRAARRAARTAHVAALRSALLKGRDQ